ncbi:hypothetical protein Pmar_PMAR012651 [Perkinsus marinus ATCC 50983]|uniref:Fatty acid hydroxylase domain-containing protein n=1 Tax=Perkinsus marinus (strain ATCC 50983 / TXsc) TaxID=423536 RepID=C5K7Y1_PERM5|nr:hypothetical protein Pmar_PMAR012651 [Perkinsus marinus ATCC 50983]EER19666.1 hypothetical protein Pmar_PMAR012651 [Perkinsus marinus ATCC 50983]|eukprot:XP_002787870.1 hypothetical protein Pmar_PMAR012651 [Perkinsus marinus ATCC 50983]
MPIDVYGGIVKAMLAYVDERTFMVTAELIRNPPGFIGGRRSWGDLLFLRGCAVNTILVVPLIGLGGFCLQQHRDRLGLYVDMDPERLPSKLEIAAQMIHWLFHASPYLYRRVHKVHHEYPAPNAFTSLWPWIMWFDHQPDFDDFHHEKSHVNYGNMGFLDRINGTDGLWRTHLAQLRALQKDEGLEATNVTNRYCD